MYSHIIAAWLAAVCLSLFVACLLRPGLLFPRTFAWFWGPVGCLYALGSIALAGYAVADTTSGGMTALPVGTVIASANSIPAAPWVAIITPYLTAIASVIVPAILAFVLAEIKKYTGINAAAAQQDQIASWASTEAGALIAKAADNLAGRSFTVSSPEVQSIVNYAPPVISSALTDLGMTPSAAAKVVAGEIGKLQASQTVAVASPTQAQMITAINSGDNGVKVVSDSSPSQQVEGPLKGSQP
jgi:hypothetical protein